MGAREWGGHADGAALAPSTAVVLLEVGAAKVHGGFEWMVVVQHSTKPILDGTLY